MDPKKQAPADSAGLSGEPNRIALNVPRGSKIIAKDVKIIIRDLKDAYPCEKKKLVSRRKTRLTPLK